MGYTFWLCLTLLLLMTEAIPVVKGENTPGIGVDVVECFRCDDFSPCLQQELVCNLAPDCANGRDELETEGGGCYRINPDDGEGDDDDEEERRLGPVIYAIVGLIGLEVLAILGTVMVLLNVHCCQCSCRPGKKTRPKAPNHHRTDPTPKYLKRSHTPRGADRHFYTEPRRTAVHDPRPRTPPEAPVLSFARRRPLGDPVPNRFPRLMPPSSPQITATADGSDRYGNETVREYSRRWADEGVPPYPHRQQSQGPEPMNFSSEEAFGEVAANRVPEESYRQVTGSAYRPEPPIIPIAPDGNRSLAVARTDGEPGPVVRHHTTVNNFTVILAAATGPPATAARGLAGCPRATVTEILDDAPGTSDGRTGASSCRQLVPLHRPRKGTKTYMYSVDYLC